MPLQNRVNPKGEIQAVKSRGAFLGNRGIIHNEKKEIISPFKIKGWVTCQLEFKTKWLEANQNLLADNSIGTIKSSNGHFKVMNLAIFI